MDLQDAWMDELLDVVAAGRRLERTVVAVTADHGLRTRAEYPALRVGSLSDVMFRVPLVIYAPNAVSAGTTLQAPTSHIDLAPTLLALLGAPDAAARMHGIPVWQRTARDRLYVLASAYGGADGFLEDGRFYMHQALSGAVYASDRFASSDADQVRPGDPVGPLRRVEGLAECQRRPARPGDPPPDRGRARPGTTTTVAPGCPAWDGRHPLPGSVLTSTPRHYMCIGGMHLK